MEFSEFDDVRPISKEELNRDMLGGLLKKASDLKPKEPKEPKSKTLFEEKVPEINLDDE